MGRYSGKTCRLICILSLTASFFLVEIITGYVTNSLALVGDSYHMLSDVAALVVGLCSVRISKWNSKKNTYGWARAEVLGALVNAVFLIAMCFTILTEAIQRMFGDEHIHDPNLMIIVGAIGLAINVVGLILLQGHGHSHAGGGHGHGHSHGGGNHSHRYRKNSDTPDLDGIDNPGARNEAQGHSEEDTNLKDSDLSNGGGSGETEKHEESGSEEDDIMDGDVIIEPIKVHKIKSSAQLNMKGVFLHVMGDAIGSVIVIISALIIKFVEADWKHKVDPALSVVLVIIILSTTIPLFKETAFILLQTVPTHIRVPDLTEKLLGKVEGVLAVHEFHVWQLAGSRIIASAHIRCRNLIEYNRIAEEVKMFFHEEGIHSTTIQPEFVEDNTALLLAHKDHCIYDCCDGDDCHKCCRLNHKHASTLDEETGNCYSDATEDTAMIPEVGPVHRVQTAVVFPNVNGICHKVVRVDDVDLDENSKLAERAALLRKSKRRTVSESAPTDTVNCEFCITSDRQIPSESGDSIGKSGESLAHKTTPSHQLYLEDTLHSSVPNVANSKNTKLAVNKPHLKDKLRKSVGALPNGHHTSIDGLSLSSRKKKGLSVHDVSECNDRHFVKTHRCPKMALSLSYFKTT